MNPPETWTHEELERVENEIQKEFSQAPKEVVTLAVRLCRRKMTPGESVVFLLNAVRETLAKREEHLRYA